MFAASDNEDVVRVEGFRERAGGAESSCILATIDNSAGSEETAVPDASVVSEAGETFTYQEVWLPIGEWQNLISIDDTTTYNEAVDLYNDFGSRGSALPGARSVTLLAAEGTPSDIARVFAETDGGAEALEMA